MAKNTSMLNIGAVKRFFVSNASMHLRSYILEILSRSSIFFPIQDLSKSPKTMKKLLPKRKPERKPSDEEFALRKSKRHLNKCLHNTKGGINISLNSVRFRCTV